MITFLIFGIFILYIADYVININIFLHSQSKPISPVRLTNCGHFFCHNCIKNATKCITCDIPVQPREMNPDYLVSNLIQNCDNITEIIKKRFDQISLTIKVICNQ